MLTCVSERAGGEQRVGAAQLLPVGSVGPGVNGDGGSMPDEAVAALLLLFASLQWAESLLTPVHPGKSLQMLAKTSKCISQQEKPVALKIPRTIHRGKENAFHVFLYVLYFYLIFSVQFSIYINVSKMSLY